MAPIADGQPTPQRAPQIPESHANTRRSRHSGHHPRGRAVRPLGAGAPERRPWAGPLPVSSGGWGPGSGAAGQPHAPVSAVTHGPRAGGGGTWRQNKTQHVRVEATKRGLVEDVHSYAPREAAGDTTDLQAVTLAREQGAPNPKRGASTTGKAPRAAAQDAPLLIQGERDRPTRTRARPRPRGPLPRPQPRLPESQDPHTAQGCQHSRLHAAHGGD